MSHWHETLQQIVELLTEFGEQRYANYFSRIGTDLSEARDFILPMYAGMNSFNDLVLHRDGSFAIPENDRLERLRTELFNSIVAEL